jgi:cyanophycin synthetase
MAATDRTGFIAEWISRDKLLTKQLLERTGIPVATGRLVSDADDACRAAQEIGGAVVVKPCDADFGRGVSVDLTDPSEIRGAYDLARSYSPNVLVENYLAGYWHRLLVVDGEMIAAVRKEPPCVTGDGKRTIAELIDEFNSDPRRGFDDRHVLDPLEIGAAVLGMLYRQGYSLDSVPPAGFAVLLRPDAYLATGATQTDVTDLVHPELAETAVHAADTIGLDVAGIDLICEEISRSPADQSVGVLEVNAEPAIVVHMAPISNPARPVGEKVIASLFPAGDSGRIPVVEVANDLRLAQVIAGQLQAAGETVGLAAKDHASANGRRIGRKQMSVLAAAETLWMHRRINFGVIHFTFRDVLQTGLPMDRCDLLCLAGLDESVSHQTGSGIEEIERVLRLLLQAGKSAQEILVNLDHVPLSQRISWPAPQAILVSEHSDRAELQQHAAAGGRAITVIEGQLVLRTGVESQVLSADPLQSPLFEAAAKAWMDRHLLTNSNGPRRDSNRRISA